MGLANTNPVTDSSRLNPVAKYTSMEKYWLASCRFPSPSVFATMALPPDPSIKPKAAKIMATGKMMLTADRASSPTRLETNSPSTTL